MNKQELEIERKANVEYLDSILREWRTPKRKMKKGLVFIVIVCAIAVYFAASSLFGGVWGYIATLVVVGAGVFFANELGLSFKNDIWSDGTLAYQACTTMEILIAIKQGTYREYGSHILVTGTGKHYELYKQFIQMYPEYKCQDLEKIAKIEVKQKDLCS